MEVDAEDPVGQRTGQSEQVQIGQAHVQTHGPPLRLPLVVRLDRLVEEGGEQVDDVPLPAAADGRMGVQEVLQPRGPGLLATSDEEDYATRIT